MDPLTEVVGLLRPTAVRLKQLTARGDWAVRFPSDSGVVFGVILAGTCEADLPGLASRALCSGDYLLLASPRPWTLRDGGRVASVDFQALYAGPVQTMIAVGTGGESATRILCGHFALDTANAELLASLMASVVHVRSADDAAGRLRRILDFLDDEASAGRPGESLVLDRLLQIMLIEAFRHRAARTEVVDRGLLAGLTDPQIAAALRALHADVQHGWTVAKLAARAGMSRSMFAARFTRRVGVPPIEYLLYWRMALAKDALRQGARTLTEIARASGYQSASAFSTAFSRTVGYPPARFAALRRSTDDGVRELVNERFRLAGPSE